jgi:hypothetical protein
MTSWTASEVVFLTTVSGYLPVTGKSSTEGCPGTHGNPMWRLPPARSFQRSCSELNNLEERSMLRPAERVALVIAHRPMSRTAPIATLRRRRSPGSRVCPHGRECCVASTVTRCPSADGSRWRRLLILPEQQLILSSSMSGHCPAGEPTADYDSPSVAAKSRDSHPGET